jgi:hypothetical protein
MVGRFTQGEKRKIRVDGKKHHAAIPGATQNMLVPQDYVLFSFSKRDSKHTVWAYKNEANT